MKLQKITQKRWFWPLVCAVSVVFGWWYLSIVTCAPLGGDDELINLQNYYYITHTSFGQSVLDYLGDLWEQFSLQNGRFRPFSSPPVRGLTSWFLGDLVGYRLYILAWTYADIVLTAWLVGKASRNKKLGIACLCLLPMMFSVCASEPASFCTVNTSTKFSSSRFLVVSGWFWVRDSAVHCHVALEKAIFT